MEDSKGAATLLAPVNLAPTPIMAVLASPERLVAAVETHSAVPMAIRNQVAAKLACEPGSPLTCYIPPPRWWYPKTQATQTQQRHPPQWSPGSNSQDHRDAPFAMIPKAQAAQVRYNKNVHYCTIYWEKNKL